MEFSLSTESTKRRSALARSLGYDDPQHWKIEETKPVIQGLRNAFLVSLPPPKLFGCLLTAVLFAEAPCKLLQACCFGFVEARTGAASEPHF